MLIWDAAAAAAVVSIPRRETSSLAIPNNKKSQRLCKHTFAHKNSNKTNTHTHTLEQKVNLKYARPSSSLPFFTLCHFSFAFVVSGCCFLCLRFAVSVHSVLFVFQFKYLNKKGDNSDRQFTRDPETDKRERGEGEQNVKKSNVKFLNANNEWYNGMCRRCIRHSSHQHSLNLKNPKMFDIHFFRILIKWELAAAASTASTYYTHGNMIRNCCKWSCHKRV